MSQSCLTCATPLPHEKSHTTPCCSAPICTACLQRNPRFASYCPRCQISSGPSSLPQGLRDPPSYEAAVRSDERGEEGGGGGQGGAEMREKDDPPDYTPSSSTSTSAHDRAGEEADVIHHLRPEDTLQSLGIAYGVPLSVLRKRNGLFGDYLLSARHTVRVPRGYYSGPSLSSTPVESAEERERKARLRRFMTRSKCADYKVAELYMKEASGDVDMAVARWTDDERWERENPMKKRTGIGGRSGVGGGLVGQVG